METKLKRQAAPHRVFQAEDLPTALAQVRRELGDTAMIVGTRTVRVRGTEDLAPTEKVEVLVAEPEESTPRSVSDVYAARYLEAQTPSRDSEADTPTADSSDPLARVAALTREVGELGRELDEREAAVEPYPLAPQLKVSGCTPATLHELARSFERASQGGDPTLTAARRHLSRWLRGTRTLRFEQVSGEHWFLGRAGSGKTSLVLHLAAELRRSGQRVGILALAPQHDGDLQRLRAAAEALDVPAVAAWNPEEAQEAREGFERLDVLLVDTPCYLAHPIQAKPPETAFRHLVVPLADDRVAVRDQLRRARAFEPDAVAVTQMDLFPRPGRLVDLTVEIERPVSFLLGRQDGSLVVRLGRGETLLQAALGEPGASAASAS